MEKEFSLELLLSVTSGHQFVEDEKDIYKLVEFVFQRKINEINYPIFLDALITHLIKLYPNIFHNNYYDSNIYGNPVNFLLAQKFKYGDYLLISEYDQKLSNQKGKTFKKRKKIKTA